MLPIKWELQLGLLIGDCLLPCHVAHQVQARQELQLGLPVPLYGLPFSLLCALMLTSKQCTFPHAIAKSSCVRLVSATARLANKPTLQSVAWI